MATTYKWSQTQTSVTVVVSVPISTKKTDCNVVISTKAIAAGIKGQATLCTVRLDSNTNTNTRSLMWMHMHTCISLCVCVVLGCIIRSDQG